MSKSLGLIFLVWSMWFLTGIQTTEALRTPSSLKFTVPPVAIFIKESRTPFSKSTSTGTLSRVVVFLFILYF